MGSDGVKEETMNSQTVNMEAVAEVKAVVVNNTADYCAGRLLRHHHQERYKRLSFRRFLLSPELGVRCAQLLRGQESTGYLSHVQPCGLGPHHQEQDLLLRHVERRTCSRDTPSTLTMCPPTRCGQGISRQSEPLPIRLTGLPFTGNQIPASRISGVAKATQDLLLPAPNRGDPNASGEQLRLVVALPGRPVLCGHLFGSHRPSPVGEELALWQDTDVLAEVRLVEQLPCDRLDSDAAQLLLGHHRHPRHFRRPWSILSRSEATGIRTN